MYHFGVIRPYCALLASISPCNHPGEQSSYAVTKRRIKEPCREINSIFCSDKLGWSCSFLDWSDTRVKWGEVRSLWSDSGWLDGRSPSQHLLLCCSTFGCVCFRDAPMWKMCPYIWKPITDILTDTFKSKFVYHFLSFLFIKSHVPSTSTWIKPIQYSSLVWTISFKINCTLLWPTFLIKMKKYIVTQIKKTMPKTRQLNPKNSQRFLLKLLALRYRTNFLIGPIT